MQADEIVGIEKDKIKLTRLKYKNGNIFWEGDHRNQSKTRKPQLPLKLNDTILSDVLTPLCKSCRNAVRK